MEPRIGTRVRSLRRRADLTQARLADSLGISASYLNLIEHNKRRLPAELMFRLASVLNVDVREFMSDESDRLHEELMEVLDDPALEDADIKNTDVRVLTESQPGIARALVSLYRRWRSAQEAEQHLRALLSEDAAFDGIEANRLPSEEVNDLIQRRMNHFDDLERAAEDLRARHGLRQESLFAGMARALADDHRVEVRVAEAAEMDGRVRRYDRARRVLVLAETLPTHARTFQMAHQAALLTHGDLLDAVARDPGLTTDASRTLCRMVLASYFAGAVMMPYARFWQAAEDERYDVELLGHRFRASFEQVCHRLTTLRRPGMEGVPFHLVKTDTAGNISKRFSGSGIRFARFSAGCPRWNVNAAFMNPGRIRVQLSDMPDGTRYFCVARTIARRHGGWREPEIVHAIGLGCRAEYAARLVYADGIDLERGDVVPIGTNCRTCERLSCAQRAFPTLTGPLRLDEDERRISFYATSGPGG